MPGPKPEILMRPLMGRVALPIRKAARNDAVGRIREELMEHYAAASEQVKQEEYELHGSRHIVREVALWILLLLALSGVVVLVGGVYARILEICG